MASSGTSAIDRALAQLDHLIDQIKAGNLRDPPSSSGGPTAVPPNENPAESTPGLARDIPPASVAHAPVAAASATSTDSPAPASTRQEAVSASTKPGEAEASGEGNPEEFDKSLLQVGKVQSAENHPQSEKLLVCKVEVADGVIKQVVAGLQKYISIEELTGRHVCLVLNLKPAKLAGLASEAMIMAGDSPLPDGGEIVKLLAPPEGAAVGDRIFLEGRSPSESPPKQVSSKVWQKIVPLLRVHGGRATYGGKPLVTRSGPVTVPELPDGASIH